jgi:hypothetical protein
MHDRRCEVENFWSTFGQFLVNFWSIFGQLLVNFWSTFGQLLVNFWSTFGQLLVNNQASHIILRSHSRPHLCRQSFGIPVVFTKTSGACPTVRSVTRLIDYLHQVLSVKALLARLREALLWCAAKD